MKAGEEADNVVYCRTLPCPFPSSSSSYLLTRWLQPMTVCVSKLLMHDWRVFSCQVPRLCSRAKKEALAPLEARLIVFTYSLRPVPHWCYGDTRPPPPPPPPCAAQSTCGPVGVMGTHLGHSARACETEAAARVSRSSSPQVPCHPFIVSRGGGGRGPFICPLIALHVRSVGLSFPSGVVSTPSQIPGRCFRVRFQQLRASFVSFRGPCIVTKSVSVRCRVHRSQNVVLVLVHLRSSFVRRANERT